METISFKIDPALAKELDSRAAGQNGASRHTLCRQIIVEYLADADRYRVLQEIEALRDQTQELKYTLATAVTALLVQAGKVENPHDAEQWVRRTLLGQ